VRAPLVVAPRGARGRLLYASPAALPCLLATLALHGAAAAAGPHPPQARTGGIEHPSETSASLEGFVNPHGVPTTYYFQYGTTSDFGSQTPPASAGTGTVAVKVAQVLTGLQLATTYHYRLVATSAASPEPAFGAERTFTTTSVPLKFVLPQRSETVLYGKLSQFEGTLSGTTGGNHQIALQASQFPYLDGFGDLGSPALTDAEGNFSLRVPALARNTELRVRTLDAIPTYSQVVRVDVAALVTLRAARTATVGLMRLTGTVTPAEPGAQVLLQLTRPGRGAAKVGEALAGRARGGVSRFAALLSIRRSGAYRALVKVTNGRQVSGTSATVHIRGARPPHKTKLHSRRRHG
jgi:hypothetical protein